MDIVSHALVGRMFISSREKKRDIAFVALAGALPDFFQIPLYIFVGHLHHRPYNFPLNSDWVGVRSAYPSWYLFWDIPHSLFFLLFVIIPIVYYFKLNKLAIFAYFSHIFLDIFTHTGEWSLKPFFPLNFAINGFTDAWAWNYWSYLLVWAILITIIMGLEALRGRIRAGRKKGVQI